MATLIPQELCAPAGYFMGVPYVTAYTATGVIGVMRTFEFNCFFFFFLASAYLAREAGGEGTVIIENVKIPGAGVPARKTSINYNGGWVVPSGGILQVRADSGGPNDFEFGAWGYEHV